MLGATGCVRRSLNGTPDNIKSQLISDYVGSFAIRITTNAAKVYIEIQGKSVKLITVRTLRILIYPSTK
jgi:hypothetical protein